MLLTALTTLICQQSTATWGATVDNIGAEMKEIIAERGMTLRAAAREMNFDPSVISRVMNGKQKPSDNIIATFNRIFETGLSSPVRIEVIEEATYNPRNTIAHLLTHDDKYGGDHVASAAVQIWKAEHRALTGNGKEELSTVAELAESSGWLLYDAGRQDEARQAFLEAQSLAHLAGDKPLEWFCMDLLAMHDVYNGHAGEALSISNEMLSRSRIQGRVALMARVRQARALGLAGDHARSLDAMERAAGAMQDSVQDREPSWVWWITENEITTHYGELLMALGDPAGALPYFVRATEEETGGGLREFAFTINELLALASVQAWSESETALLRLAPLLDKISSTRSRLKLRKAMRIIRRDAPSWLVEQANELTV